MLENIKSLISLLNFKERLMLLSLTFVSLISFFLDIIGIALVIPIMSYFSGNNVTDHESYLISKIFLFFHSHLSNEILNVFIFFIIIFFLKAVLLNLFNLFQLIFLRKFSIRLYTKSYNDIIYDNFLNSHKHSSSKFIRDNIQTINLIGSSLSSLVNFFSDFILLFGITIFLFFANYFITTISFIILFTFTLLVVFILKPKIEKYGYLTQNYTTSIIDNIGKLFGYSTEIKIYNLQNDLIDSYISFQKKKTFNDLKSSFFQFLPRNFFEFIGISIVCMIFFVFVNFYKLTFDEFLPLITIFILSLIKLIPVYNRGLVSLQQINYSKDHINSLKLMLNRKTNHKFNLSKVYLKKYIEFKNVFFSYKQNINLLNNFSKKFYVGQIYGLSGPTGSGKTTFVNLLSGLIKQKKGKILSDGKFKIYENKNWFHLIGYSRQSPYISSSSILENITFKNDIGSLDKNTLIYLNEILSQLSLDKKINSLDNKLNSLINPNSTNLSGGEKQRISIARALFKNPKILILDESTSSLDLKTENKILNYLVNTKKNKIIFIISHQESTLKICDEIINF